MARAAQRRNRSRRIVSQRKKNRLPFTSHNYILFGLGLVMLVIGYIFMSIGPVDSFWSLTLSPIILVIGYLIIIPLSFLYQHPTGKEKEEPGKGREKQVGQISG